MFESKPMHVNKLGCYGSYRAACSIIAARNYTTLEVLMLEYYIGKAVNRGL